MDSLCRQSAARFLAVLSWAFSSMAICLAQSPLSEDLPAVACETILPVDEAKGFGVRTQLWPGQVIPYVLEENMRPDIRQKVLEAITVINAETNVCLIPRLNERDYVDVFASTEGVFYAFVGKDVENESQPVAIGPYLNVILHEFGHSFGLLHEHQRPDRDAFIKIIYENVSSRFIRQFDIVQNNNTLAAGPYDYSSIMHYGPKAFTWNGLPTIEPRDTSAILGNNRYSPGDIRAINLLYPDSTLDCDAIARSRPPVAKFRYSVSDAYVCAGSLIQFRDATVGPGPSTLRWHFENGVPATSEDASPVVSFTEPGLHLVTLEASNAYGSSVYKSLVEVSDPRSLPFVLFPNPNDGHFTASGYFQPHQPVEVQVFSAAGTLVHTYREDLTTCNWEKEIALPTSLSSGYYLVRFVAGNDIRVVRVIVDQN